MPARPEASPGGHRPLALARRLTGRRLALAAAATVTVAAVAAAPAMAAALQAPAAAHPGAVSAGRLDPQPACGQAAPSSASCLAIVDTGLHWTGQAWTTGPAPVTRPRTAPPDTLPAAGPASTLPTAPAPYMAASLQSAYKLRSSLLGAKQTIAVVDAYDNPDAAADLAVYRKANKLPACTKAFPCFEKVNQQGQQGHYPVADASWAVEESLDVDMASAICPNCHIILVEADDSTLANLATAEDEAAKLGATVISNSYGGTEYAGESALAPAYDHPGIAITASSGDEGFGVKIPSAFGTVTAAGGTSLYPDPGSSRGWAETAWQYAGSGCSAYTAQPAWQDSPGRKDTLRHDSLCGTRTTADVSAVADPDTPVAVYDSGDGGWLAAGGTSVASPVIAGVYALAGNAATIGPGASHVYAHPKNLFGVTSGLPFTTASGGANGDCGGSYLCTAGPGYDGPTGLGTPDGTGAF
jgi:Subtilase family